MGPGFGRSRSLVGPGASVPGSSRGTAARSGHTVGPHPGVAALLTCNQPVHEEEVRRSEPPQAAARQLKLALSSRENTIINTSTLPTHFEGWALSADEAVAQFLRGNTKTPGLGKQTTTTHPADTTTQQTTNMPIHTAPPTSYPSMTTMISTAVSLPTRQSLVFLEATRLSPTAQTMTAIPMLGSGQLGLPCLALLLLQPTIHLTFPSILNMLKNKSGLLNLMLGISAHS